MSFINANTANPNASTTPSGAIGTQQTTILSASYSGSTSAYFLASSPLTPGVWLINACLYFQSSNLMNNVQVNILYNQNSTTPISVSSAFAPESSVNYINSTNQGLNQVTLNTMTVLYVDIICSYGLWYGAATTNGQGWSVLNSSPQQTSILRATKIA